MPQANRAGSAAIAWGVRPSPGVCASEPVKILYHLVCGVVKPENKL